MAERKSGVYNGESLFGKIRKSGTDKILPLLAATSMFSDGSSTARTDEVKSVIVGTVGDGISKKTNQEKKDTDQLLEVGRDCIELDFLKDIKELLPDVKARLIEEFKIVSQAARDSIFESRMKSSENNRQEYFERIALKNDDGKNIREIMSKAALEYNVPVNFILAVAGVESNFLQNAEVGKERVKKGKINWRATGMFMLQQQAAINNGLKVENIKGNIVDERRNLGKNIQTGIKILGGRHEKFGNNWFLAVQSYHDGYAGVIRHLNNIFPDLTLNKRKDDFDENGWKIFAEMQTCGDLNSTSLFLMKPDCFQYANEVQGMLILVNEFLDDELKQKTEPKIEQKQ